MQTMLAEIQQELLQLSYTLTLNQFRTKICLPSSPLPPLVTAFETVKKREFNTIKAHIIDRWAIYK
jgi:hypothetical protein